MGDLQDFRTKYRSFIRGFPGTNTRNSQVETQFNKSCIILGTAFTYFENKTLVCNVFINKMI